jgi:hypothetical protein
MELNKEGYQELWRQAVHNKTHQLFMDSQDLRSAFEALLPPEAMCHDKFILFERQITIVQSELKRLTEYVSRLGNVVERV